ncbi:undecaprenyl-phosphate glucose phosphotransferase [candidate division WOR-3 bacterium]|nr:undecaprenyl-phosphate glucose phosphotransferase [candidate division WOR-3 bacterium]
MKRKSDIIFFLVPIVLDAALIMLAFNLSYWIRFYSGLIPITKGIPVIRPYLLLSGFAAIVWIIVFYISGFYDIKKTPALADEIYQILRGIVIGIVIVLLPTFFYREFTFSRITILLAYVLGAGLTVLGKMSIRMLKIALYHRGIGIHNACIVGGGESAKEVLKKFSQNPVAGYKLVGQIIEKERNTVVHLLPVLGKLYQLREIIKLHKIDTLILTFSLSEHKKIAKILIKCNGLPVDLRFVPDPYELLTSRIGYYELDGFTLLGLKEFPLTHWNALLKSIFDIVITSILLILCLPIIIISSIFVKLSSKGPLFYHQERVGRDGNKFNIIKFRTMKVNAEASTGPIFATANDSRITRFGRKLRRWSIDEIPQLINVLKGNMSLVGPRPERPEFVKKFSSEISRYLERHRVKPGITGWAQVNGLRGDTSVKERVKYDLYYIENWSFGLDIKILLRTFIATLKGENAY